MDNNISIITPDKCCGCRACGDSCNLNAISYYLDEEGFYQPIVDKKKCVSCGKCLSVCPLCKTALHEKIESCYAAYASEKKDKDAGSSGGIFGLFASMAIKLGYVVYGAAFDSNLRLCHQSATSYESIHQLLKSKYLQSDTSGIYNEINNRIKCGEKVLFCGTPCQCNALLNFLGGDSDNLLLVDFVCHGVPSQDLFNKSIAWWERKHGKKIKDFVFRYKGSGVKHPQSYKIVSEDKSGRVSEIIGLHYQFPFYFAFQKYISLRQSCYSCKWAKPTRCSDITLGDFWGIESLNIGLVANEGVSMIAPNTPKGESWLDHLVSDHKIVSTIVPYSFAVDNNGCLKGYTKMPSVRSQFFSDLKILEFDEVVLKYMKSKRQYIFDIYYAIPTPLRRIVRRIMEKRMRYE